MIDLLCTNVTLNQPLHLVLHLYRKRKRERETVYDFGMKELVE